MMDLLTFLRRRQMPTAIMVGKAKIPVPNGKGRWESLRDTVLASVSDGDKLLCLDDKGETIRGMIYDADAAVEGGDEDEGKGKPKTNETELVLVARLLREAGDSGASRYAELSASAFGVLNSMLATTSARMTGLEAALYKQMEQTAKANAAMIEFMAHVQAEQAGQGGGLLNTAFNGFVEAVANKALAEPKPATNGAAATNGKAKKA